jgi:hypothetical protein
MKENDKIKLLFEKLIASEKHLFPVKGKVNCTTKHGVYVIYSPLNEVLHVGRTTYGKNGLNGRLTNHITKAGVFYREYLKPNNIEMRGVYFFNYIEISDPRQRALLEALTAGKLCPVHIGIGIQKNKK